MAADGRRVAGAAGLAALLAVAGCTHHLDLVNDPPRAAARTTAGPWASMVYVARTDSGVIAIDLGWGRAERALDAALKSLGAAPADVRWVFLTHAHRDHIRAWPAVRQATFVLGAAEVPYLTGEREYRAILPRYGDRLIGYQHPAPGALRVVAIGRDTAFALGRDTVFALGVPGHTAGSTAYLFRRIVFGGDAINWRPLSGFRGTRPEFSDDVPGSRRSMTQLWQRLQGRDVRAVCSAHGKCASADSTLRVDTQR